MKRNAWRGWTVVGAVSAAVALLATCGPELTTPLTHHLADLRNEIQVLQDVVVEHAEAVADADDLDTVALLEIDYGSDTRWIVGVLRQRVDWISQCEGVDGSGVDASLLNTTVKRIDAELDEHSAAMKLAEDMEHAWALEVKHQTRMSSYILDLWSAHRALEQLPVGYSCPGGDV